MRSLFQDDEATLGRYLSLVERLRWAVSDNGIYNSLVALALFSGEASLSNK